MTDITLNEEELDAMFAGFREGMNQHTPEEIDQYAFNKFLAGIALGLNKGARMKAIQIGKLLQAYDDKLDMDLDADSTPGATEEQIIKELHNLFELRNGRIKRRK